MNQAKDLRTIIENMHKVLGWQLHSVEIEYETDLEINPEHVHHVEVRTVGHGTWICDVRPEMRAFTTHSILGDRTVMRNEWVLTATITKDGGYWDPPYEDEIELAADPSLGKAYIDALLSNLRAEMYDALPYSTDDTVLDITKEDVPQ